MEYHQSLQTKKTMKKFFTISFPFFANFVLFTCDYLTLTICLRRREISKLWSYSGKLQDSYLRLSILQNLQNKTMTSEEENIVNKSLENQRAMITLRIMPAQTTKQFRIPCKTNLK